MESKDIKLSSALKWITEPIDFAIKDPDGSIGLYCATKNTCYDYTCTNATYTKGSCPRGERFVCYDFQHCKAPTYTT